MDPRLQVRGMTSKAESRLAMAAEPTSPEPQNAKPSMMPKLIMGGFITVVILFESCIYFFMVPSAEDVAALAESRLIEKIKARLKASETPVVEDTDSIEEFKLGLFGLSFTPSGSDRSFRVEFDLRGTVKKGDLSTIEKLFAEREGRFRHRMTLELRNTTLDELKETQLGLIQRRILATSNEVFETPILLGVVFYNYDLIEE
jgi:hypothetical protein